MNCNYLNIPVSLCYVALQKKCIPEFQLFCWLKTQCSGHFKLNNQLLYDGITQLEITKQTFLKRLKTLVSSRWLGLNNKTGSYHINSFKVLHNRTGWELKTGVLWEDYNFSDFKSFVYAATFYKLAKTKRWYEKQKLKEQGRKLVNAGTKKGRSRSCIDRPSFPLPINYAAKKLKKPPNYISRMKNAAKCAGFIHTAEQKHLIETNRDKFDLVRKYHPEKHKLIVRKGKLYEQLPDKILFLFTAKNIRRLKQN